MLLGGNHNAAMILKLCAHWEYKKSQTKYFMGFLYSIN